jgi:hypothetical protein
VKRFLAAVVAAALLAAIVPGVASADRPTREEVDRTGVGCAADLEDGTFVSAFVERNAISGDFAAIEVFPLGAEVPSLSGSTTSIDMTVGAELAASATIPLVDAAGDPAGEAQLTMTLPSFGEFVDEGEDRGNLNSHTHVNVELFEGFGTISLPGASDIEATCSGGREIGTIFQTSPGAFTEHRTGVNFFCQWMIDDTAYFAQGQSDTLFGDFVDVSFFNETVSVGADEPFVGSFDGSGVDVSLHLLDFISGDEYTASVEASFAPDGDEIHYVIRGNNTRQRVDRQPLSVEGTVELSTGDAFTMDDEACDATTFRIGSLFKGANGPKTGRPLVNDAPEGAIELAPGARFNVQTTGTVPDAEAINATCDEGEIDQMGHTVWYTIEGTGTPLRFDTTGSNFDTMIAVYVMEGDELVELACADDVFDEGISLQAVLEGDTVEGVTYWIQVGGWGAAFGLPEAGRLHVELSEVGATATSTATSTATPHHRARRA